MKFYFWLLLFSQNIGAVTLQEIKEWALEKSSTISAQEMETHALTLEANHKSKWQNPQLMSQVGSLKSGSIQGMTVEVSVTQAIPLSDKFSLRKEMAELAIHQQKNQNEFYKKWVTHQALLAAWKVHIAQELFHRGVERAKRISLIKSYLQTRPRVTIKQKVDLSIISSILVQLETMQDQKKQELELAKNDLTFWTGKKILEKDIPVKMPDNYLLVPTLEISNSQDTDLLQAKNQLQISKLDSEIAKKEKRPDLFLGGGYRVEDVVPVNHFSYAIIGINIPIWDTGKSRWEIAQAREKRDQKILEEMQQKTILKQQNQIERLKYDLAQLKRFPKSFIHSNELAIKNAEIGFQQSLVDVNTFIQAETQSHEVIDQVYTVWLNYLEDLSAFQLMKGEEFNWEKK